MKSIISLHRLTEEEQSRIQHAAPGYTLTVAAKNDLTPHQLAEAEIIFGWSRTLAEQLLQPTSSLRWVQAYSAGVDTLPLSQLAARDITLTTASGVHAIPIAESLLGMMLSFSRQLHTAVRHQAAQRWEPRLQSPQSSTLGELRGSTLAILGVGSIGSETARLAQAFGMRVIGVRRSGTPAAHVDRMYTLDELEHALAEADYIANLLPLTPDTKHVMNAEAFAKCKQGAVFLNAGRGPTVDTAALSAALASGQLGGAGLDVFEQEPLPAEHPLWTMENVIITPHVSGSTEHYTARVVDIFVDNLKAYVQHKKPPRNLVDYGRSY